MKFLIVMALIPLFLPPAAKASTGQGPSSYCSSFLKNIKSNFSQGIEYIESSQSHRAYDAFGETLMRIRAESKYLNDCEASEKELMAEIKEKSARTLTALHGQMK